MHHIQPLWVQVHKRDLAAGQAWGQTKVFDQTERKLRAAGSDDADFYGSGHSALLSSRALARMGPIVFHIASYSTRNGIHCHLRAPAVMPLMNLPLEDRIDHHDGHHRDERAGHHQENVRNVALLELPSDPQARCVATHFG